MVVQPTFNRHTTLQNNNLNTYILHSYLSALHVLNHAIIAKTIQGRYHNSWPTYKQESWGLKRVFVIWPMLRGSQNFHVGHQMLNTPSWLVCHYQIIIKILCMYLYIFPTMSIKAKYNTNYLKEATLTETLKYILLYIIPTWYSVIVYEFFCVIISNKN